jgi:hypothetical protein
MLLPNSLVQLVATRQFGAIKCPNNGYYLKQLQRFTVLDVTATLQRATRKTKTTEH